MYNKSVLLGRLTKNPTLEKTRTGKSAVTFTVACGYGEKVDFVKCKAYDEVAENLCKYQKKGNLILVEATIKAYSIENAKERTYHQDIVANKIQYAESKIYADDAVIEEFAEEMDTQFPIGKKDEQIKEDEGIEME